MLRPLSGRFLGRRCAWVIGAWLTGGAAFELGAQDESFGSWIELFNGRDLSGWVNAKPKEDHHRGPNRWKVDDDGSLTNVEGGVNDICSVREFDNYELELWYKVPEGGNSGVYLRGMVEVQIFDNGGLADDRMAGHHGGAIYGGFSPLRNPQNPAGTWNHYRIRHLGDRVTVWHNGLLVQDNTYTGPTPGRMREHPVTERWLDNVAGPIMFQGDHSKVWYRDIRVRRLCSPADGWRPLWNGADTSQFRTRNASEGFEEFWAVESSESEPHALTNVRWGGGGDGGTDLWTRESFGNFLVHYEYRVDPNDAKNQGGNSGFYLRDQWEIQIHARQQALTERGRFGDGGLYSLEAPTRPARHAAKQWNHIDARVDGMRIWVWQNGILIHDGVELATRTDNHNVPTQEFSRAPFKLQGDHGKVWFTNLHIKELADPE